MAMECLFFLPGFKELTWASRCFKNNDRRVFFGLKTDDSARVGEPFIPGNLEALTLLAWAFGAVFWLSFHIEFQSVMSAARLLPAGHLDRS